MARPRADLLDVDLELRAGGRFRGDRGQIAAQAFGGAARRCANGGLDNANDPEEVDRPGGLASMIRR